MTGLYLAREGYTPVSLFGFISGKLPEAQSNFTRAPTWREIPKHPGVDAFTYPPYLWLCSEGIAKVL